MAKINASHRWRILTTTIVRNFACHFLRRSSNKRYIVLLGGPGAGKGTLATQLAALLGIAHLGMGDVLRRKEIQLEFGDRLAEMSRGGLVPDSLILEILERELARPEYANGAILDGIPRTLEQALLLERRLAWQGVSVNNTVLLDVEEEELVERLSFRRICPNLSCRRSYHLKYAPPQVADICDACKGPLIQRPDDVPEVIRERLRKYSVEILPLCKYYQDARRVMVTVKSTKGSTPQEVLNLVMTALSGN